MEARARCWEGHSQHANFSLGGPVVVAVTSSGQVLKLDGWIDGVVGPRSHFASMLSSPGGQFDNIN